MKRVIIIAALVAFASVGFAQAKKDTTAKTPEVVRKDQFFLVLTKDELVNLFAVIRTSKKFVGGDIEEYIDYLNARVVTIPTTTGAPQGTSETTVKPDSTAKKK